MSYAAQPPGWPGNDPVAIALAAKIAMLSAASRTCAAEPSSRNQKELLAEVAKVTASKHVDGRQFPEFLSDAKQRLEARAHEERLDGGRAGRTLNDVLVHAQPVDVIGAVYAELVRLASERYEATVGQRFDPPLKREVVEGAASRPFPFAGRVPPSRTHVGLVLHAATFDLQSLALIPYVLAHELVCHIGAGHVDHSRESTDPAIRMYFADGFMDRAAWLLLLLWIDSGALVHDVPVGQLTESDVEYASRRPRAFRAGRAAWSNCSGALSARMREDLTESHDADPGTAPLEAAAVALASAEAHTIETALRLNACACGIPEKDDFVDLARANSATITGLFADVARLGAEPLSLFEHAAAERSSAATSPPSAR